MTDAAGVVVSQQHYKAWGETRYTSGSEVTKYQYTGQYSYSLDFGLQYYNARWYDPSLGRFAQADSIIPGAGNSSAWDRYAYTLNNPLRYNDPSGHVYCGLGLQCGEGVPNGGSPTPAPGPVVVNGGSFLNQPHDPGPPVSTQMPIWTTDRNKNPVITIPYTGTYHYGDSDQITAKYYMSIVNRDKAPANSAVVLICYSGGTEACLMYAKWRIDNNQPVHSVTLLGPTFSANNENNKELSYGEADGQLNDWADYIQYIRNKGNGARVLIINDSVNSATAASGDPEYHDISPILHYSDDKNIPGTNNSDAVKNSVYSWIFNHIWVQP